MDTNKFHLVRKKFTTLLEISLGDEIQIFVFNSSYPENKTRNGLDFVHEIQLPVEPAT